MHMVMWFSYGLMSNIGTFRYGPNTDRGTPMDGQLNHDRK